MLPVLWQREKDSNPHIQSQSLLCYPYTIPLSVPTLAGANVIIRIKGAIVNRFSKLFFKKFLHPFLTEYSTYSHCFLADCLQIFGGHLEKIARIFYPYQFNFKTFVKNGSHISIFSNAFSAILKL